jgi:hypothetical protein
MTSLSFPAMTYPFLAFAGGYSRRPDFAETSLFFACLVYAIPIPSEGATAKSLLLINNRLVDNLSYLVALRRARN